MHILIILVDFSPTPDPYFLKDVKCQLQKRLGHSCHNTSTTVGEINDIVAIDARVIFLSANENTLSMRF